MDPAEIESEQISHKCNWHTRHESCMESSHTLRIEHSTAAEIVWNELKLHLNWIYTYNTVQVKNTLTFYQVDKAGCSTTCKKLLYTFHYKKPHQEDYLPAIKSNKVQSK